MFFFCNFCWLFVHLWNTHGKTLNWCRNNTHPRNVLGQLAQSSHPQMFFSRNLSEKSTFRWKICQKSVFFTIFVDYSPIYGTDMEKLWTDAEKTPIHVRYWEVKPKMAMAFHIFLVFFLSIMIMKIGRKIIFKIKRTKEKCKLGRKDWRNEYFCGTNRGVGPHGLSHTPWYEHLWTPVFNERKIEKNEDRKDPPNGRHAPLPTPCEWCCWARPTGAQVQRPCTNCLKSTVCQQSSVISAGLWS